MGKRVGKSEEGQPVKREEFSSRFGLMATAVGSAVGLGNIWRFPYIVGQYGGGAFLIVYLAMVAIIGIPIMVAEFIIGREGRLDAINSFKRLAPDKKWHISGVIGIGAAFLILAFYGVVAGWTLEYILIALKNGFVGKTSGEITGMFGTFISHPIKPVVYQLIVMGITGFVVSTGVQEGVERAAKVLIPLLVVIMILLNIQSFLLPGGKAGFDFLFKPDFTKLTKEGVLAALGHAFFSLSLGMGIMITYGSYIPDQEDLASTAIHISIADTILALLSGIAIFPAVFAFGIDPTEGAGLVFVSLPNVFAQMKGGYIFGVMFFLLLFLAALTSTISLLETVVAYVVDNFNFQRKNAAVLSSLAITTLGVFASLSNGVLSHVTIFGDNIFDFLDNLTANYFLTGAAFISVIFIGWALDKDIIKNQITSNGKYEREGFYRLFMFMIRYIAPIGIIIVQISLL